MESKKKALKGKLENLNQEKKYEEQCEFLSNIELFLTRGYSLVDTLNMLNCRFDLDKMKEEIKEGKLFYEVLDERKYDQDVLLILELSEESGDLKNGISQSVKILEEKINNKNQILELIKYPLLLLIIIFFTFTFITVLLIPQFELIYASYGIEKTLFLSFLYASFKIIPIIILIFFITMGIFIIFLSFQSTHKRIRIYFKLKYVKQYYLFMYNHIFVINLSNLLSMGLRLDQIFDLLSSQTYNLLLAKESMRILEELKSGKLLYEILDEKIYSYELIYLIKEGEENGTIVDNLGNYSLYLQKNKKEQTKKLMFLIQPIFYGIFSIVIIILYISIFIPMFEIMDSLI